MHKNQNLKGMCQFYLVFTYLVYKCIIYETCKNDLNRDFFILCAHSMILSLKQITLSLNNFSISRPGFGKGADLTPSSGK